MSKLRLSLVLALTIIGIGGCGIGGSAPRDRSDPDESAGGLGSSDEGGRISDIQGLIESDSGAGGDGLTPINRHLWRASLDTLAFLPLNSTDPFTGVVATDWAASPEAPNERLKVTAYIKSPALSASSLQVAVFREIRGEGGSWVSAPVSGSTARQLEDAILLRARELKIAERKAG